MDSGDYAGAHCRNPQPSPLASTIACPRWSALLNSPIVTRVVDPHRCDCHREHRELAEVCQVLVSVWVWVWALESVWALVLAPALELSCRQKPALCRAWFR